MAQKIIIFFVIYLFLNILNLFLIDKTYAYYGARKDFAKVLGEVSDIKNNGSNYQLLLLIKLIYQIATRQKLNQAIRELPLSRHS